MSSDKRHILEVIPRGSGRVLDLGGNKGTLRGSLQELGYHYINIDCKRFSYLEPTLIGDAHCLCFKDETFTLVVSKCTFEHFSEPWKVVGELRRILKENGRCIIWVPFMHPFHGDDYYRYTPLGIRHMFRDFKIISIESPNGVFSVLATAASEAMKRVGLARLGSMAVPVAQRLDRLVARGRKTPLSYAAAYRVVMQKVASASCFSETGSQARHLREELVT